MRAFRRVLVVAVTAVAITVPVAVATIAAPFGPVEVVDPVWKPWDLYLEGRPILGVDGVGNALFASTHRTSGDDQVAAVVEARGGPGEREGDEQPEEREDRALDRPRAQVRATGVEPLHAVPETAPDLEHEHHPDEKANREGKSVSHVRHRVVSFHITI